MEKLLQYAWQYRLWESPRMRTTAGQELEILDPGWLNTNAGPDFFNSKLIIDSRQWAGNVEIHDRASDWYRHGHQNDEAYDSVILHVVGKSDADVCRRNGEPLPQVEFKPRGTLAELSEKIRHWHGGGLLCAQEIAGIPEVYIADMTDSLAYERLYSKAERVRGYLERGDWDYEQALFTAVARALGFGVNSDAMERVALSVPLSVFRKHSDNLLSLEAILLGQAGLIGDNPGIRQEYDFMRVKFSLEPVRDIIWKRGGIRPANFPERRLRLLARMLFGGAGRLGMLLECRTAEEIISAIATPGSGLSRAAAVSVTINAVIPVLFLYGTERRDETITGRVIDLLHQLPAERNSICALFSEAGLTAESAYQSQALIELRNSFCRDRKCLYCRIGNRILRRK